MDKIRMKEILQQVLENVGIPEGYYSIGSYKEGSTCMEKVGKKYIVYDVKSTERYESIEYKNELEACTELIRRIVKNNKDFEILRQEFYDCRAKAVLKAVLDDKGIPRKYYSLEGYVEDAVCMEKNNKNYIVYIGKKGNKYNVSKHSNISKTLLKLISEVAQSYAQEEKIVEAFINKLYKMV